MNLIGFWLFLKIGKLAIDLLLHVIVLIEASFSSVPNGLFSGLLGVLHGALI